MLFTFPSRYLFTIGHQRVFSLTRWFSQIPTDFHLFRGNRDRSPESRSHFRLRDFHLLWFAVPSDSTSGVICHSPTSQQFGPRTPHNPCDATVAALNASLGLGFSPFARHYSGNRDLLFIPQGTEIFHFPWLTLPHLWIQHGVIRHYSDRVAPFGDRRVKGCFRLSDAYRR